MLAHQFQSRTTRWLGMLVGSNLQTALETLEPQSLVLLSLQLWCCPKHACPWLDAQMGAGRPLKAHILCLFGRAGSAASCCLHHHTSTKPPACPSTAPHTHTAGITEYNIYQAASDQPVYCLFFW